MLDIFLSMNNEKIISGFLDFLYHSANTDTPYHNFKSCLTWKFKCNVRSCTGLRGAGVMDRRRPSRSPKRHRDYRASKSPVRRPRRSPSPKMSRGDQHRPAGERKRSRSASSANTSHSHSPASRAKAAAKKLERPSREITAKKAGKSRSRSRYALLSCNSDM